MSESTPTTTTPDKAKATEEPTRYCAYDNTLLRFIGSVGTKAEATKVAKAAPDSHDVIVKAV